MVLLVGVRYFAEYILSTVALGFCLQDFDIGETLSSLSTPSLQQYNVTYY